MVSGDGSLDGLVDLERYPLHDLDGAAGRELIAAYSARLAADGACVLPGFVAPRALDDMVTEVDAVAPMAFAGQSHGPAYYGMSGMENSNLLIYGPRVAGMAAAVEGGHTRAL